MSNQSPFKWRHFEAEIILLCVRWYLRYALSYRNLEEMMLERGLQVDHTTIYDSVAKILSSSEKAYSKIFGVKRVEMVRLFFCKNYLRRYYTLF